MNCNKCGKNKCCQVYGPLGHLCQECANKPCTLGEGIKIFFWFGIVMAGFGLIAIFLAHVGAGH